MIHIELLVLKLFNCGQIKLLMFDNNNWKHLKLLVLAI